MSGSYGCGHLTRDAAGCPECRAAEERMRLMLRDIPLGHRHGPCRACDKAESDLAALRAKVEELEAALRGVLRAFDRPAMVKRYETDVVIRALDSARSLLPGGDDASREGGK